MYVHLVYVRRSSRCAGYRERRQYLTKDRPRLYLYVYTLILHRMGLKGKAIVFRGINAEKRIQSQQLRMGVHYQLEDM